LRSSLIIFKISASVLSGFEKEVAPPNYSLRSSLPFERLKARRKKEEEAMTKVGIKNFNGNWRKDGGVTTLPPNPFYR
jgi:hypothetical protein